MREERSRAGVAFWATVIVVVPLFYVASFGPACWMTSWTNQGAEMVPVVYSPIVRFLSGYAVATRAPYNGMVEYENSAPDRAIRWYSGVGAARGWGWFQSGHPRAEMGPHQWGTGPPD